MRKLIVIGSSTGGINTLKTIFSGMPTLDAATLIIQHMPSYISTQIAEVFQPYSSMPVNLVYPLAVVSHGQIWIGPGGYHTEFKSSNVVSLNQGPKICFVRPSVDAALRSITPHPANKIMSIILTGMGKDGTEGTKHIKSIGGITIAQKPETCVIQSMPCNAIETGCVDRILAPEDIRKAMVKFSKT